MGRETLKPITSPGPILGSISFGPEVYEDGMDVVEERMLKGGLLDMWQLYLHLSTTPDKLSDLTPFDAISARDGMLFPDFFRAVHRFLHPSPFEYPHRVVRPEEVGRLEDELDETFKTMQAKWVDYMPFFERHPELRYLHRQNFKTGFTPEFAEKLPHIRNANPNWFWSLQTYHKLRGNLQLHLSLEKSLTASDIGTLFQQENSTDNPGDFFIYLNAYGEKAGLIEPYLRLLKHGDHIGFGNVAVADAKEGEYLAVSMLQTDLLRRDRVHNPKKINFTLTDVDANEDGKFTVPASIRRPYVNGYAWAHRIVDAIERAAIEVSQQFPIAGVIIPTASSYRNSDFTRVTLGKYSCDIYEEFPMQRGYQKRELNPVFPLSELWGESAVLNAGRWWVKPIDEIGRAAA